MFSLREVEKITKMERNITFIFNALVHHAESDLLIRPGGDKFYVKSNKSGIFITVSSYLREISIINHVYGYNVKISPRVLKHLELIFTKEVEKRRLIMENEYKNNIQYSLDHIANTIKERL